LNWTFCQSLLRLKKNPIERKYIALLILGIGLVPPQQYMNKKFPFSVFGFKVRMAACRGV
jgi:hypothetical protein